MRVGEGVARGVARRVSACGSFGGLTPTKPRFLYFRSVAVPDIGNARPGELPPRRPVPTQDVAVPILLNRQHVGPKALLRFFENYS